MRIFFAIDQASTVQLNTIRNLLELHTTPDRYAVLPLEAERFHCPRNNLDEMVRLATHEGRKLSQRYADLDRCVIVMKVYLPAIDNKREMVPVEYGVIVHRNGAVQHDYLNPELRKGVRLVSSPDLQSELVERAIEISRLMVSRPL